MSLTHAHFAEFFSAVHGDDRQPFPWQERLLRRVLGVEADSTGSETSSPWPEVLALPTGSGKTTCLDVALFALACQSEIPPHQRTAPRRIIFVVDRRVIVDEAFEHACHIRDALREASFGILRDVADALLRINGGTDAPPLTCHQLRGGIYRDDAWARTPTQPCVICSTVDQIGSRLLFRGYGKSFKSWPVHAGLAGNDSLIILDEAHCAKPFLQTMRAVERYRSATWAEEPVRGPFHFAIMSATPPAGATDVFQFDISPDGDDLRDCEVLRRRLTSSKPTRLVVAKNAKGDDALEKLADELVQQAFGLVSERRKRIGVLVNRVRTARLVRELLTAIQEGASDSPHFGKKTVESLRKKLPQDFDVVLLTGRMRPIDRDRAFDEWQPRECDSSDNRGLLTWFGTSSKRPDVPRPAFVVATQCLEVGANLDFDGLVSECASLDALRQRFGRLNRTGRDCDARAVVVIRADQVGAKLPDPVYGGAIDATWEWLNAQASSVDEDKREIDFGIAALQPAIESLGEEDSALTPPSLNAPVMLPAHVDCWVQTSPTPCPDPDVAIFLHGPDPGLPEVQVCWRGDLPAQPPADEKLAIAAVELCPPARMECLPVQQSVFRSWWQNGAIEAEVSNELTDVEGDHIDESDSTDSEVAVWGVVWRGTDDSFLLKSPNQLRPGDLIVLPSDIGGWLSLGEVPRPTIKAELDVAEVCQVRSRRKAILRLHPALIATWLTAPTEDTENAVELSAAYNRLKQLAQFDPNSDNEEEPDCTELSNLLSQLLDGGCVRDSHRDIVSELLNDQSSRKFKPKWERHPFQGLVVRGVRLLAAPNADDSDTFSTEDDSASESVPVSLARHCDEVGQRAADFATACGLPMKTITSLRIAGRLHDLGKADPRFQALLHGGNQARADLAPTLFAKSDGLARDRGNRASRLSQLPAGFRHEQLSLTIAQLRPELIPADVDVELVLHLIAMHHGWCRPLARIVSDPEPRDLALARLRSGDSRSEIHLRAGELAGCVPPHCVDSQVTERFWQLVRRFGWWGLAWIETIFVLADHRTSEEELRRFSSSDDNN